MTSRRRLLESSVAGAGLGLMGRGAAVTQSTPGDAASLYIEYWELLRSTVPAGTEGATALVDIAAAGGMSVIEQSQVSEALTFMQEWQSAADAIDIADVPEYARIFHKEFVDLCENTASRLEYTDLKDITDSVQYWGMGLLAMLIGARDEAS